MTYAYQTPTLMPIESVTTFGLHAKPNTDNPIGFFGTGLKYAIAIILRMNGKLRLFRDGVEYEFYLAKDDFRGKPVELIRMKKRKGVLSRWTYDALPFTTDLGKNWGLWQAHRELMSNTKDEAGIGYIVNHIANWEAESVGKTIWLVDHPLWEDMTQEANEVFLDKHGPLIYENDAFRIYDNPSKYIYYRGVRVHDMRYPARFTYDFKTGHVQLSEDRTAKNAYSMFWAMSRTYMSEFRDKKLLYKALNRGNDADLTFFEGHDLTYSSTEYGVSDEFRSVARTLHMKGFATSGISSAHLNMVTVRPAPKEASTEIELFDSEWDTICTLLKEAGEETIYNKIREKF